MTVSDNVLESIGNTPLVRLTKVVPHGSARVLVKLEWANPTGSMKDRMALASVEAAERDGRLPPGGTVVEYTGGSTGVSLALVCAAKGYRLEIVTSDAFSEEKIRTMRAFGAHVTVIPSDDRKITEGLIKEMIETARSIHGASRALRRHNPGLHVAAVEPSESPVLSGGPTGSHKIEGIGIGFVPPLWRREEVDEILTG